MSEHTPGPWEAFNGYLVRAVRGTHAIPLFASRPSSLLAPSCAPDDLAKAEAEMQANLRIAAMTPELLEFARDCAVNWDCDQDAHRYGTTCRVCEAAKLLAKARGGE